MSNCAHLNRKTLFDEETILLSQERIYRIEAFNFHWQADLAKKPVDLLKELKQLSTIASVGASTRIEGSSLSDEEVLGYYEALSLVFESYDAFALRESSIKQLHGILLKYSSKDTRPKGDYKHLTNKVVAKYPDGISKVIFNTTEPHLTAKEMSELVAWTNEKLSDTNVHSLVIIAIFIYEFLSIHPFQDGNGRLSRILTNLLLMRAGYDFVQYISLEQIIEERKKFYYQYLMHGQKNRYTEKEDIDLWIIFFLDCIELAIERLKNNSKKVAGVKQEVAIGLNDRQQEILDFIASQKTLRMKDLVAKFTEIPRSTMSLDLELLVEKEFISRNGRGRGTWYQMTPRRLGGFFRYG